MKMRSEYAFSIFFFSFAFPLFAFAAGLVPCGGTGQPACNIPCFYVLIHNVINFVLYDISIPLAATALMVAGILLVMGGSETAITRGKAIFKYTLTGLFLAFGAWLIIDLILGNLLRSDYKPWNRFPSEACGAPSTAPPYQPSSQPPSQPPSQPSASQPSLGAYTEQQARDFLSQRGIGVKPVCPAGQSTDCVNLEGIKQSTLNEVASLANQVGASNVYITAGTEGCGTVHATGQRSHCTGDKVDLRVNPTLDSYIQSNYTYIGQRSGGAAQYRAPDGAIYAREGGTQPHWDVLPPA